MKIKKEKELILENESTSWLARSKKIKMLKINKINIMILSNFRKTSTKDRIVSDIF